MFLLLAGFRVYNFISNSHVVCVCSKAPSMPMARQYNKASSSDYVANGAAHAFKPKDFTPRTYSAVSSKNSESPEEIKAKINRLSQTLANATLVSRLPDRGDKLKKQMHELDEKLTVIESSPKSASSRGARDEVICLDDQKSSRELCLRQPQSRKNKHDTSARRTFKSSLVYQNKGLMFPLHKSNCKKSTDSNLSNMPRDDEAVEVGPKVSCKLSFILALLEIQDPFSLTEQGFDVSLTQKQLQQEHGYPLDM
ncbi:hypothetical protein QYE76_000319 [Lolium multiflorum]|uniref:Uncharacterized protein n=1 Tax=Lolium multiflorum TaxID=4521 RepID=A0AAD8RJ54_LOLMU|nr:hypothetical protein QYE76_000319 [Lolium multiflorum]